MLNVLLVDDDRIVLEGLKKFVDWGSIGYKVAGTALSAREAVRFIETNPVDVLLTDIVMTGSNGFALIQDAHTVNPYIKTVVLSSYSTFKYAQQAIRLGSFDYLSKPVNLNELKEMFVRLKSALDRENSERSQAIELKKKYEKETAEDNPCIEKDKTGPVIGKVLRYIDENYSEDITLKKLSEVAFVHPVYLSKLFKEKVGMNFIDYLTKVRIKNAERLLENLSLRIYDISDLVGYDSPKHFSKVFRESTGMTPKEYREHIPAFQEAGKVS